MARKQNVYDVMPIYRRICRFNLTLHLFFMMACVPQVHKTFSIDFWLNSNASKTKGIPSSCFRKTVKPGIAAMRNANFTFKCLSLLFVLNIATWLSLLLLCGGDIHPNPGPQAAESSNDSSFVSNVSTDIFSHLSLHHNISFVQYNVQSIVSKLDILQAELHDIDILSFTETWLSPDISTEDTILQS